MDFIADFGLPEEETRPSLRLRLDTRAYNLMYNEARKQVGQLMCAGLERLRLGGDDAADDESLYSAPLAKRLSKV